MTTTLAQVYTDIAVPIDFSALGWRVLPLAEQIADSFDIPIQLLHVDTASPWSDDNPELLRLRAKPFRRPVQVQVIPDHDVGLGIARAITGRRSLIVMGTHARTGAAEMFLESSTEDVLRAIDGPALLAGPRLQDARAPLKRIVCCLDLDTPPEGLLEDVRTWARHLDLPVELVTVLPMSPNEALDEMREQERRLALLADGMRKQGIVASALVLRGTRPGREIVDYANGSPGTVVALATHARTASVRAVVGSVGMKVVRHAHGPVLLRRRDA